MYKIRVKVAGVTFKTNDGQSRQKLITKIYDDYWTEGEDEEVTINLIPEPTNEFDPSAVIVEAEIKEEGLKGQIGYIPSEQSQFISGVISDRKLKKVVIEDMGCLRGGTVYVNLELTILSGDDSPEDDSLIDDDGCLWDEPED